LLANPRVVIKKCICGAQPICFTGLCREKHLQRCIPAS